MGFVMLGISTLTDFGINAAIFGMVALGLITGMLFFIAGSVKDRYHTLEIGRLGGMLIQAPRLGWILGFTSMASLGLPGLAGFWGEFPAILSAYRPANGLPVETFRGYMVVAAVGTVLAAGYLLWLLQRTAMGEPSEEFANDPEIVDVTPLEWASWTPFLFLIVLFGVAPGLIFEVTDPAVVESLNNCLQFENGCDGVADATTAALGLNLMLAQLAQEVGFVRPAIDWHAVAPELTLLAFGTLVTVMDIVWLERGRRLTSSVASIALLVTMIPIITLALDGEDRVMFGGAFVVDNYALVMKAMFLLAGYVVVLLSTNYVAEGDYWENEYYGLLLSSILGMVLMASARDLITVFVALELLSIPAYMLATWQARPQEQRGGPEVLPDGCVRFARSCSTACRCSTAAPARPC